MESYLPKRERNLIMYKTKDILKDFRQMKKGIKDKTLTFLTGVITISRDDYQTYLTMTDTEIYVQMSYPIGGKAMSCSVEVDTFMAGLKGIDDEFDMELNDKGLILKGQSTEICLAPQRDTDGGHISIRVPHIEEQGQEKIILDTEKMLDLEHIVKHDEEKLGNAFTVLDCVYITKDRYFGSNGFSAGYKQINTEIKDSLVIQKKILGIVSAFFTSKSKVTYEVGKEVVRVSKDNIQIYLYRLFKESEYPYETLNALFNTEGYVSFKVDGKDFTEKLKKLKDLSGVFVNLEIQGNQLCMQSTNGYDGFKVKMPIESNIQNDHLEVTRERLLEIAEIGLDKPLKICYDISMKDKIVATTEDTGILVTI